MFKSLAFELRKRKIRCFALQNQNTAGKCLMLCGVILSTAIAYRIVISQLQSNLEFKALDDWRIIFVNVALFFVMYTSGLILVQIRFHTLIQIAMWLLLLLQSLVWFSTLYEFFGWVGFSAIFLVLLHWLNFFRLRKQQMISPLELRNRARSQCYVYFDKNIRKLPKNKEGEFVEDSTFTDSDIDAFRHACVSGIFTMRFGYRPALIFGWLQEFFFPSGGPAAKAMDNWNNKKGRDAAKGLKSEKSLFRKLHKMLNQGELATSPNDPRLFGAELETNPIPRAGRFIRLGTSANGADVTYFELTTQSQYTRKQLVNFIKAGKFPEYCLRKLGNRLYPVAKPDTSSANNLS